MKMFSLFGGGRKEAKPRGRCFACHEVFDSDEDAYCRYCGKKRGAVDFYPLQNMNVCVYGPPPVEREHSCTGCGYSWTTNRMIDRSEFCPKCGERVTTVNKEDL